MAIKQRQKFDEDTGAPVKEFTIQLSDRTPKQIDADIAEMLDLIDFGDEDDD
jgi:hypothetical protein